MRKRTVTAWRARSSAPRVSRSGNATVTSTPLTGWRGRALVNIFRKPLQVLRSVSRSLSCVVKRPAVSISTAWSVNHQSQLRVPPTPRTAWSPTDSASGNFSPQLCSAVVLPEPGAPMIRYQGSSYR